MNGLRSTIELIYRGGWVMIPLLLAALVALTVIIERLYLFRRAYQTSPEWIRDVFQKARSHEIDQAKQTCLQLQTPTSAVILAGLDNFMNPVEEMEISMKNQAEAWIPELEKRIDWIDTVITAAPLMGLLGTITGMMGSFQVLSEKGVNEPNAITGGVAEALIATATGLVIALTCLLAYNYLTSQVKQFISDLELAGSRLLEIRMAVWREKQTQDFSQISQKKNVQL